MNKMLKLGIILSICCLPLSLQAAQRWFHIEIIIFKQYDKTNEIFDQTSSQIRWPSRTSFLSSTQYALSSLRQSPRSYASVQGSDRLLNNSYGSLRKNNNFEPLAHLSWVQSVGSNQMGGAVRIQSGAVDGFVSLQRGSYLHLLLDLEFSPGAVVYHLREKRRLKLNETHYLDHPKFGVIAKVTPL